MMRGPVRFAILSFLSWLVWNSLAQGQDTRSDTINQARTELSDLRADIGDGELQNPVVVEEQLRAMRDLSRARLQSISRELESLNSQISALGPAPEEGAAPESEDLAAERAELREALARLNSQRTRVNANIIEANDLLAQISSTRLERFYAQLLTRGTSLISPQLWREAGQSAGEVSDKIGRYFSEWSETKRGKGALWSAIGFIAAAFAIAVILFGPVNRWVMDSFSAGLERRRPTPARRIVIAGMKMLARATPGLVGGLIVIETLRAQDVLTPAGEGPARALWVGLVIYLLVSGFLRGLFSPTNAQWRIAAVDAASGRAVSLLINAIVIIFGVKNLAGEILTAIGADPALDRILSGLAAITVSGLLFALCRSRIWRLSNTLGEAAPDAAIAGPAPMTETSAESARPARRWRIVRRIGRAIAIGTIIAAVTGYVGLADFIASRIYYLSIILALAWFARALLLELGDWLRRRSAARSEIVEDPSGKDKGPDNFRFWNSLIINILMVIALSPAILVLVGLAPTTVGDMAKQALFGFQIGTFQFPSLAKLLVAIAVFIAIMTVTRFAQQGFRKGPFAHSNIDIGVQNSLITLIGYAGVIVALFASISAVGFDLSNLALIAGALSVGIGFGLQSIVNNFVSGLILLFERPIKVGDWVVTASGEGTVQRISVRSTEISTFDRSSIIVPNSELISSTVTNWTHKDKIGRVTVPVGVAYGSDVEKVRDILLTVAVDHPLILDYPESFIVWQDFGDSSLNFELRGFLSDISKGLMVRTDLRFAIYRALAEAGIEIPFPQRDVHVKSWPPKSGDDNGGGHGDGND